MSGYAGISVPPAQLETPRNNARIVRTDPCWARRMTWVMAWAIIIMLLAAPTRLHSSPQSAVDDWPMYQHDPRHSGRTTATIANTGPLHLQWAYSFGERIEVEAQPVISNEVVYLGAMNGEMHALDAVTGAKRWIAQPGGPIAHTAAVAGNRVYFGSLDGNVYALATSNGSLAWTFATGGPVVSAPTIVGGQVYIGSNDGNLYALDANTGNKVWSVQTNGPVVSSPAVANGLVYFGSEDLRARCAYATTGALKWQTQLYGAGMHNTFPIISDDGQVVIFVTVKPGGSSYVPLEGYPNALSGTNPVATWSTFYQAHPNYRSLYYLNANTGSDLWNPATLSYTPMPIPYWGLLHPILSQDGTAWFPAPAGTQNYNYGLDHDTRLFQVNLATGQTTQRAGGALPEFQLRPDEVGRHIFAGNDYYYTISEDVGVYRPSTGTTRALFSNGNPSGYNFGSHMDPLSPLPSRHLWRYGGAIAMGGVPSASPPIVVSGTLYYASYSWLYAIGPTNKGKDPVTSFPARDARSGTGVGRDLTYLRHRAPSPADVQAEIQRRAADIVALGPSSLPITARWEQAGDRMLNNEFYFEVYGFEADLVRVLSEALPLLPSAQQTQLKSYLSTVVTNTLLTSSHYDFTPYCLVFGVPGVQVGDANCQGSGKIIARWLTNNPNLVSMRLYALWAYANATGDWSAIQSRWSLIVNQFATINNAYNPALGFSHFEDWRVGRLNIGAQIQAAQAVRDMATRLNQTTTRQQAQTLLTKLLNGRIALAGFVPNLYDTGQRQPAQIRLNPNGTIVNQDIMGTGSPYNSELIPYDAALRNRDTDSSQVNWWDGTTYRVDAGMGFMYYPALSGYFPLSSELVTRLRADLLDKTRTYVKSYEVNNPWWWMSDLAHHTTDGGEHLYHSPTLSWTMFQVKAHVLQEDWMALASQLPEPVSFNSRYDLYRLENLITLLTSASPPDLSASAKSASDLTPSTGQIITFAVNLYNSGAPITVAIQVTDVVPVGMTFVPGSLTATIGTSDGRAAPVLVWSGIPSQTSAVTISYAVAITETKTRSIENIAVISAPFGTLQRKAVVIVNGYSIYLPLVLR